jgi:hypothetical protein
MATTELPRQQNRRRSPRNAARATIRFQCRKGALGFGPNLVIRVLDLSSSGVRLVVNKPLECTDEVEIVIDGHGMKGTVRRLGIVRWNEKLETGQFCVGIEFHKYLDFKVWQTLTALI